MKEYGSREDALQSTRIYPNVPRGENILEMQPVSSFSIKYNSSYYLIPLFMKNGHYVFSEPLKTFPWSKLTCSWSHLSGSNKSSNKIALRY